MSTTVSREESQEADVEMIRAVRGGDATAYRGLVEKYQGRVYHMVYGMVRNREDARDITQDAFVKAYNNLGSFREQSSFYTWLYRIAMNLAIDFLRKAKRRGESSFDEQIASKDADGGIDEAHTQDSPSKTLERKQLMGTIMDALEKLPATQREVLVLVELQDLTLQEASVLLDIPLGTAKSRLRLAKQKFGQAARSVGLEPMHLTVVAGGGS